jgi:hypothetical protein
MTSYSAILSNASDYVKSGLIDQWKRWIILIILSIIQVFTINIVPLFSGYLVRVYGTEGNAAPEIDHYGKLFIDGWKLNIVTILYMIPAIIVALFFGALAILPAILGVLSGGKIAEVSGLLLGSIGILIALIIFILITLIMNMAFVHFSRSGHLIDAFSIGSITAKIQDGIGWGSYIVIWIIVWILMLILSALLLVLCMIPILALIIFLLIAPLWSVFIVKIYCNIYDNRP